MNEPAFVFAYVHINACDSLSSSAPSESIDRWLIERRTQPRQGSNISSPFPRLVERGAGVLALFRVQSKTGLDT